MNHIKPYNESTECLYKEISKQDFCNYRVISLPKEEFYIIKHMYDDIKYDIKYKHSYPYDENTYTDKKNTELYYISTSAGPIYKLDDEYYIISHTFYKTGHYKNQFIYSVYYKCDTIEGVIQCLNFIYK